LTKGRCSSGTAASLGSKSGGGGENGGEVLPTNGKKTEGTFKISLREKVAWHPSGRGEYKKGGNIEVGGRVPRWGGGGAFGEKKKITPEPPAIGIQKGLPCKKKEGKSLDLYGGLSRKRKRDHSPRGGKKNKMFKRTSATSKENGKKPTTRGNGKRTPDQNFLEHEKKNPGIKEMGDRSRSKS